MVFGSENLRSARSLGGSRRIFILVSWKARSHCPDPSLPPVVSDSCSIGLWEWREYPVFADTMNVWKYVLCSKLVVLKEPKSVLIAEFRSQLIYFSVASCALWNIARYHPRGLAFDHRLVPLYLFKNLCRKLFRRCCLKRNIVSKLTTTAISLPESCVFHTTITTQQ